MTWFEDLTPYSYSPIEFLTEETPASSVPMVNVGWLEEGHSFPQGAVPGALVARLRALVTHSLTQQLQGWHDCTLCPGANTKVNGRRNESHPRGNGEIRAVGVNGTRYAAPLLVEHYVTVHQYAPPQAFIDAVLRTAVDWESARARDLCLACGSPMVRKRSGPALRPYGSRERLFAVLFSCAACGAYYSRGWPLEEDAL
jgi:hypothetical protein